MALVIKQAASAVSTSVSVVTSSALVAVELAQDVANVMLSMVKSLPSVVREVYDFIATLTVESIEAILDIKLSETKLTGRELAKKLVNWLNEDDIKPTTNKGYLNLK